MKKKFINFCSALLLCATVSAVGIPAISNEIEAKAFIKEEDMKGLNELEREFVNNTNLFLLGGMRYATNRAKAAAEEQFISTDNPNQGDGNANAFKHTYWNALLVGQSGENATRVFTTAHEVTADKVASLNKHDKNAREMDLLNNEYGRQVGINGMEFLKMLEERYYKPGDLIYREDNGEIWMRRMHYYDVFEKIRKIEGIPALTALGMEELEWYASSTIKLGMGSGHLRRLDSNNNLIKTNSSSFKK